MSTTSPAGTHLLRTTGMSAGYGGTTVVHEVDLAVAPGEVVAVVGANGSGKSTLLKALLGLAGTTAGAVQMLGSSPREARSRGAVGYVPQGLPHVGTVPASVREVVSTGRAARSPWWHRTTVEDHAVVSACLVEVGLAHLARSDLATLSGGQQRRALVARALAAEPRLLLLDEPNAGVDADSERAMADALGRRVADGLGAVLVTHQLGAMRALVTRTLTLHQGRAVPQPAPHREVGAAATSPVAASDPRSYAGT